jgi:hypothetical protein
MQTERLKHAGTMRMAELEVASYRRDGLRSHLQTALSFFEASFPALEELQTASAAKGIPDTAAEVLAQVWLTADTYSRGRLLRTVNRDNQVMAES